jgi:hypothetical protein
MINSYLVAKDCGACLALAGALTERDATINELREKLADIAKKCGGYPVQEFVAAVDRADKAEGERDELREKLVLAIENLAAAERQIAEQDALLGNPAVPISAEGISLIKQLDNMRRERDAERAARQRMVKDLSGAGVELYEDETGAVWLRNKLADAERARADEQERGRLLHEDLHARWREKATKAEARAEKMADYGRREEQRALAALADLDEAVAARDEALKQADGYRAACAESEARVAALEDALRYFGHHLDHGGLYGPWREDAKRRVAAALKGDSTK